METKRIISQSLKCRGGLDDDYTLYENGEILHEYDRSNYPGNFNLEETLTADQISQSVKERLLDSAKEEDKDFVRKLLKL